MLINDCNLPLPVYIAMSQNNYVPRGFIGPSSLKQGVRQIIGRKRFPSSDRLASREWRTFTGTVTHIAMEQLLKNDPRFRTEIPLEVSFNSVSKFYKLDKDVTIGGTCDLLFEDNGEFTIWDYKTMATTQIIDDEKIKGWEEQINIYRWLLITSNTVAKIDRLFVCGYYMDWTCTKSLRSRDVNDIPCPTVQIKMWTREQVEKYIYDKVTQIQKYIDSPWEDIPYCSPEERWCKPPKWSVCKVQSNGELGSQLPKCGFDNEHDAEVKLIERQSKAKKDEIFGIKKTGGISTMCKDWCDLSRNGHCDFLTKNQE